MAAYMTSRRFCARFHNQQTLKTATEQFVAKIQHPDAHRLKLNFETDRAFEMVEKRIRIR